MALTALCIQGNGYLANLAAAGIRPKPVPAWRRQLWGAGRSRKLALLHGPEFIPTGVTHPSRMKPYRNVPIQLICQEGPAKGQSHLAVIHWTTEWQSGRVEECQSGRVVEWHGRQYDILLVELELGANIFGPLCQKLYTKCFPSS